MSKVVPLIRGAALVPFLRWMNENGRKIEPLLKEADLASVPFQDPDQPISVFSVVAFQRALQRTEGPDIGCRVVSSASTMELATLGKVALGTRTPREALTRVSAVLPYHCTHERITLSDGAAGVVVRESFSLPFDAEILHLIQQYVASLIRSLCRLTGKIDPIFDRVQLVPHPEFGVAHLRQWLGPAVVPSEEESLAASVRASVIDAPFPVVMRDRTAGVPPSNWQPLQGDGTLRGSAREIIAAMLSSGKPSIGRLAAASGTSVRTLQRRLEDEGVTFSELLDDVRRDEALRQLPARGRSIGDIAQSLGYASQSKLTRAVRRWTGKTPRQIRSTSAK